MVLLGMVSFIKKIINGKKKRESKGENDNEYRQDGKKDRKFCNLIIKKIIKQ